VSAAEEIEQQLERIKLWLNLAAIFLKQRQFALAAKLCRRVLAIDKACIKALYRRAQAHLGLGNLPACREDLEHALELCPTDSSLRRLAAQLYAQEQEHISSVHERCMSDGGRQLKRMRDDSSTGSPIGSASEDVMKPGHDDSC